MLLFEDKLPNNIRSQFVAKVQQIANDLDIDPNWLMLVMQVESDLNPAAVNSITGATGLIQFMPETALALGTTVYLLRSMNALEQLDYVYKYYRPYKNHITKFDDLYLITLYPNADGKFAGTLYKNDMWQLPDSVYRANGRLDMNGNGALTVGDIKSWLESKIPKNQPPEIINSFYTSISVMPKFMMRNAAVILVVSFLIAGGVYYVLSAYYKV